MAYGLTFRLELEDGTRADPPTFPKRPRHLMEGRRHDPARRRSDAAPPRDTEPPLA
jgi:hypothetical protein